MMSYEMMVEVLEGLGADVSYEVEEEGFDVVIEDFDGFDEDYSEIMREFDDPAAVERFEDMLEEECLSYEDDFYVVYHFEGFDLRLGYSSFDI